VIAALKVYAGSTGRFAHPAALCDEFAPKAINDC
jgi:hypothetical protein